MAAVVVLAAPLLTLGQAESSTRANLPAIHLARAQVVEQRAVRDEVFSSYVPQLSGSVNYSPYLLEVGGGAVALGAPIPPADFFKALTLQTADVGIQASQLIYDFNQTLDRIKSNDALVTAQKANQGVVWNSALLNVRAAYFTCQQNLELIGVAQRNLEDQKRHVDQMAAFVEQGTHAPIDLSQARQQEAAAKYALIQSQGNYLTAKAALQQNMGLASGPDFDVNLIRFPPVPGEDAPRDALLPEAVAARPEVFYLREEMDAQRLAISATSLGWTPSVSAVAGVSEGWGEVHGVSGFAPDIHAGLALSWPFFLGGYTQAATRQTEAMLVALQAQYDAQVEQIRNDVESARVSVVTAKGAVGAAEESLRYAKDELQLAEGEYAEGIAIALVVFDASVAVFQSGGQLAQAEAALATGRAQLLRAVGREKYGASPGG
jgi:outer membrane protein